MRRWPAVMVAVMVAVVALAPAGADQAAATVTRVGWWSQQPGAQAQPSGGFQVAIDARGPESVAAVEVSVASGGGVQATLTLAEGSSVASSSAAMQVCTTSQPWNPANPGAWSSAPASDCSRHVALTRDAATTTWKADVSSLVTAGGLSELMIVPVAQPVGGVAEAGFQVTITKATIAATATPAPAPAYVPPPDTTPAFNPSPVDTSVPAPVDTTPAPAVSSPAPPATTPSTLAPSSPQAAATGPIAIPNFGRGPVAASSNRRAKPWGRLVIVVPLALLAGAGAVLARRRLVPSTTI